MYKLKELLLVKNIKGIGKSAIYKKYWRIINDCSNVDELIEYLLTDVTITKYDVKEALEKSMDVIHQIDNRDDIYALTVFDEKYPKRLLAMGDKSPLVIYFRGNVNAFDKPNIAMIGTRKPSEWSEKVEKKLTQKIIDLSDRVIVGGLALGCDSIAHDITTKLNKQTIAILPSGVDVITPKSHNRLADEILYAGGCIASEYEPGQKAYKNMYVERDDIVAALSDITFVMECGKNSGTMHTVEAAHRYKKIIGCFIPDDMSKGDYSGNEYIIREFGGIKVSNNEELAKLLLMKTEQENGHNRESEAKNHQMTLSELLDLNDT